MRGTKHLIPIALSLGLMAVPCLTSQTFEVNQPPAGKKSQKAKQKPSAPAKKGEGNGLGWGSGIETAREARAVQQALSKGDYKAAIVSANRAANAAPQNADL